MYWDAGYLLDGMFVLLDTVYAFNQNFYTADGLVAGQLYRFQVSSVNEVGESQLSQVIGHYAQSKPDKP